LHQLLYEALETEMGGVQEYLEQTEKHEQIVLYLLGKFNLDPDKGTPGRKIVRHIGESLVSPCLGAFGTSITFRFVFVYSWFEILRLAPPVYFLGSFSTSFRSLPTGSMSLHGPFIEIKSVPSLILGGYVPGNRSMNLLEIVAWTDRNLFETVQYWTAIIAHRRIM
jgi:hypothetical protein